MSRSIEDIFPLTPMQHALLLQTVEQPGAYLEQFVLELDPCVEAARIHAAWQRLIDRHVALRTSLHWSNVAEPTAVVISDCRAPWQQLDIESDRDFDVELARASAALRETPLALTAAPLMRLLLVRSPNRQALVWLHHHAILDGWSVGILLAELEQLVAEPERALAPAPSYRAFAQWLAGADPDAALAHWRPILARAERATPLPFGRTPRLGTAVESLELRDELTAPVTRAIEELAQARGLTTSTIVRAAWALVLSRHAGESIVSFGAVTSGRDAPVADLDRMVGLFINTVPVVIEVEPGAPTAAWLDRLHAQMVVSRAYEHVSPGALRPLSKLPPELPLFFSVLAFENHRLAAPDVADGAAPVIRGVDVRERPSLALALVSGPGHRLPLRLAYDGRLFTAEEAKEIVRQVRAILEDLARDPSRRVCDLGTAPRAERPTLPARPLFTDQFLAAARRQPDAPALTAPGAVVTYAELAEVSERWAVALRQRGARAGSVVALRMPKGLDLVTAAVAVLRSGAAFLVVDPQLRGARREQALGLARLVVATDPDEPTQLSVDELRRAPSSPLGHVEIAPEDPAYVVLTSGSTGEPKACVNVHDGLANVVEGLAAGIDLPEPMRTFQLVSPSFDGWVSDVCLTLGRGGVLHVPDATVPLVGEVLAAALNRADCNFLLAPPSVLVTLDTVPASLRTVVSGGEACPPDLARRWPETIRLYNAYGPSEASIVATVGRVERVARDDDGEVALGEPLARTEALVLGPNLERLPPGASGEIYLGGAGVGAGYAGRPDLTAEVFVPDPDRHGQRLYRTGDRAVRTSAGALFYRGRRDEQLKIRGYRVDPEEVARVLESHASVTRAVVVGVGDALVAFVRGLGSADVLAAHCRALLPAFMVPSRIVLVDDIPITRNGKADRRALAALAALADRAPENGAERDDVPDQPLVDLVVRAAEHVLGQTGLRASDSFMARGGHSLLAVQLKARLEATTGLVAPLEAIFRARTFAELADRLGGMRPARPIARLADRRAAHPVSTAQERLWVLDRLDGPDPAYHVPLVVRLRGDTCRDAMARAFGAVCGRHEALRTGFEEHDGVPRQRVHEDLPVLAYQEVDEAALDAWLTRELRAPFDLAQPPLIRGTLVRVSAAEHVLCIVAHHIVTDGASMEILANELAAFYAADVRGLPPPVLAEARVAAIDAAAWQRAEADDDAALARAAEPLANMPALTLKRRTADPVVESLPGQHVSFACAPDLPGRLERLCRDEGVTLFMALLAAFEVVLARAAGQRRFAVGVPVSGRTHPDLHGVVGFLVNTVAIPADVDPRGSFRALLRDVRRRCIEAYAHQSVPFERIVDRVGGHRSTRSHPIYQVMLTLQRDPERADDDAFPGLEVLPQDYETGATQVELTLDVACGPDGLRITAEVDRRCLDTRSAASFVAAFERCLTEMVTDPAARHAFAPLWDPAPAAERLPQPGVYASFARWAAAAPHAVAIVDGRRTTSYVDLVSRIDATCAHLARLGVRPGDRVASMLPVGVDHVALLLAALRMGAVFVPLDSDAPPERRADILADARPAIIVGADTTAWAAVLGTVAGYVAPIRSDGAVLLYTSGSTGRPKGVLVPDVGVATYCAAVTSRWQLSPADRMLQFASTAFDVSLEELLAPLLSGGAVVLGGRPLGADLSALGALIDASGVTIADIPAALFHEWASGLGETTRLPASLRVVCVGGEELSRAAANRWFEHGGCELHHFYGPTEASIGCVSHRARAAEPDGKVPLGTALPGFEVHVFDEHMMPAASGSVGELYLGGPVLALGYANDPAATALAFVPHPDRAGERLYKTGDHARCNEVGELLFEGRRDDQIKLRGHRVELGDVSEAIRAHAGVAECFVAIRGTGAEAQLVAWVQAPGVDVASLRASVGARVPAYMVPSRWALVSSLPVTTTGKIDRARLPDDAWCTDEVDEPPASELECAVADAFCEVLALPTAHRHINFFHAGGNSLLAIRLQAAIERRSGRILAAAEVFESPTVATLAARVAAVAPVAHALGELLDEIESLDDDAVDGGTALVS